MTHIGNEIALRTISRFCKLACYGQFFSATLNKLFQVMPMFVEFFTEFLLLVDVFLGRHEVRNGAVILT